MQSQPPAGANLFVWILAESQRIRESQPERVAASIQRIEAKQRAQECSRPKQAGKTPSR